VGRILIRRTLSLLLVLALVAGTASGAVAATLASPAMAMTGMAAGGDDGCPGCTPDKMAVGDCGVVCVVAVAIVQPPASLPAGTGLPAWGWRDNAVRSDTIEPATAPPRS
jgi:hypothetical protein